eukprot:13652801-Alexandrium_andersonii.AAC.1
MAQQFGRGGGDRLRCWLQPEAGKSGPEGRTKEHCAPEQNNRTYLYAAHLRSSSRIDTDLSI